MTMVASHPLGHSALNVRVHRRGGRRLVVELIGDVDGAVSGEVEALVSFVVAGEPTRVDIDLRPVAFIDLGGLRAIGRLFDELRARRSRVSSSPRRPRSPRLRDLVARLEGPAPS